LSVILAGFVAAWAVGQFRLEHRASYAVTAVVALAASGTLVWYASVFQRKTKNL
jgi:predicted Co/Zn/Cd cation transporter (cation efflux family)